MKPSYISFMLPYLTAVFTGYLRQEPLGITGNLKEAIGYVKASNTDPGTVLANRLTSVATVPCLLSVLMRTAQPRASIQTPV